MPVSKLKLIFFIFFLHFPFSVFFYVRQWITYFYQRFYTYKYVVFVLYFHFRQTLEDIDNPECVPSVLFKKKCCKSRKIFLILFNSVLNTTEIHESTKLADDVLKEDKSKITNCISLTKKLLRQILADR